MPFHETERLKIRFLFNTQKPNVKSKLFLSQGFGGVRPFQ